MRKIANPRSRRYPSTTSVRSLPPTASEASRRRKSTPASVSFFAAHRPARPPPTMTTSASVLGSATVAARAVGGHPTVVGRRPVEFHGRRFERSARVAVRAAKGHGRAEGGHREGLWHGVGGARAAPDAPECVLSARVPATMDIATHRCLIGSASSPTGPLLRSVFHGARTAHTSGRHQGARRRR